MLIQTKIRCERGQAVVIGIILHCQIFIDANGNGGMLLDSNVEMMIGTHRGI